MDSPLSTTLVNSVDKSADAVVLASAAGLTNPSDKGVFGQTDTFLLIDTEYMLVSNLYVDGETFVPVIRGCNGTLALPHAAGAAVTVYPFGSHPNISE